MNRCAFCNQIEQEFFEINEVTIGDRILLKSKNFLVIPSYGQIVEGYLLIVPRKHYVAVGEIPTSLYYELEKVQDVVRDVLKETYGQPIFFEHGPASQIKKGGCCIDHAHLHCVPLLLDILEDLAKHFRYNKINSLNDLKEKFKKEEPYFFLENNVGEKYLFHIPDVVPSQYIRRVIAGKIGRPERWDWRSCVGIEEIKRTIEKLKGKFRDGGTF